MRMALFAQLVGQVQRTIDFTAQTPGPMTAATFLATYAMTIANSTAGGMSLMLDPNTLQTGIGSNTARFDKGSGTTELLVEEAKTNGIAASGFNPRAFPTGWGGSTATQTAAFANGPDFGHGGGVSTACRVQTTAANQQSSGNHWTSSLPTACSFWYKSNTGSAQPVQFRWSFGSGFYFPYTTSTSWQRYAQNLNIGSGTANFTPVTDEITAPFTSIDMVVDAFQQELGYASSYVDSARTDGDHLTDNLTNWIQAGQLNVAFTFRPQASPTFYTSNPRLLSIKNIGGTVVSYIEVNKTTGIVTVNLNGTSVSGNVANWAAGDVIDVFVTLGSGVASIGYRRNGGPCTSMIYTSLAGAVVGNTIAFFSNYGTQVLSGGYRMITRYGANTTGPSWYDGGANPPLIFDFTTQPVGRMSASAFAAAYPYFPFARSSAAGVVTSAATYDLTCAIDEPGFGSYDSTNQGLSLLETRQNQWAASPHVLTPGGSAATVTPNFAAGPDGNTTASRVQSGGSNQYCGFMNAPTAPVVSSIWVKSHTGSTQNLSKFYDFSSFSGPYPATTSWAWQYTAGCVSPHLIMPVTSTATGMDVVADYAQVEDANYTTDPIIGTNGTRAATLLEYAALNTWVNSSGQLRMEIQLIPAGGSEQPTYSTMRFFDCASSGDYCEIAVSTGIVTFSIGGVTASLPQAIGWTNRRLPLKVFLECGGGLPTRIFTQEATNPAVWSGDASALAAMAAPGITSILSSRTPDKNVSGILQKLRSYPAGTWPSWLPGTPFTSSSTNTNNVIGIGDSITAGTVATSWMSILTNLVGGQGAGHKYTFTNNAVSGQSLATMASSVSSQVGPSLVAGKRNQVYLMGGANDLAGGATGATIFSNWTAWQSAVAALNVGGVTVDDIIMFTITAQGSARSGSIETQRQAFLSSVAGWSVPAKTHVIRVDQDWVLDQANAAPASGSPAQGWVPPDFNWFVNDGNFIHPNTSGEGRIAAWAWAQLLALP